MLKIIELQLLELARDGETPLLLLDDVFSELDGARAEALARSLPAGQALVTTAGAPPPGIVVDDLLRIDSGRVAPRADAR